MSYQAEGLTVLQALIPSENFLKISLEEAKNICLSDTSCEHNIDILISSPESYLILADQIPRSPDIARAWKEDTEQYFTGEASTEIFLNDTPDDPHSRNDLARIHHAIVEIGLDPSDSTTTLAFKTSTLILFGTGSGVQVKRLIDQIKPKHLIIIVSSWEEWVSSFECINWLNIWNDYCMSTGYSISAIQTDNSVAAIAYLLKDHIGSLDHSFCYLSPSALDKTKQIYKTLKSGLADRQIAYRGFAMDEYNMIINSWNSLMLTPKIFRYPTERRTKNDFLVVGSGPSLDISLNFIKRNQDRYIIIACASSFGTLRKHGINVDILCLLERGEFMVDQYKEIISKYGHGGAKLLASTTTPYQLLPLFDDPMVYFRPSLTPVSIFVEDPRQILLNEGPQTINTGVAFSISQNARSITLCGVDLGSASLEIIRSQGAIGHTKRNLNMEVKGNLRDKIYTCDTLLDAAIILEQVVDICSQNNILLYNISDGIYVEGWTPVQAEYYTNIIPSVQDKQALFDWWHEQSTFSQKSFQANITASRVRVHSFNLLQKLAKLVESATLESWPVVLQELFQNIEVGDKYKYITICPRLIRGSLTRALLAVNRQLIVLAKYNCTTQEQFLSKAKLILLRRIELFQKEIFSLFDYIENESSPLQ